MWTVPNVIPPRRPIVSECSSATYNISLYIDRFLGPLFCKHPSYLKDTYHFLELIKPIRLPINTQLFTIDIESLYTNINTELGRRTIKNILEQHPDPKRPDEELLQLLEICLRCNDFEFAGRQYLQVQGTAMGHRYAPSYGPMVRKNSLNLLTSSTITTPLSKSNMKCIRYRWTSWTRRCSWNNWTKIWKKNSTKVYFKPTDCHALLHKSSYHPKHTFKGIIKSQIIRFYRISSKESDLQDSISVLFRSLRKRLTLVGFSEQLKVAHLQDSILT